MIKVSIIIPTYNRSNLILRTLKSVFQQTYKNIQIIVIDDGSTDNTSKVLEDYKKSENFIYHYQPNQGRSLARNTGIAKASGEFLMFLDSDDYLETDAIASLVGLSDKYPDVSIFAGSYRLIEENLTGTQYEIYRREFEFLDENILLQQVKMMVLNVGNNIVRKDLIEKYKGFEPSLEFAEDWKLLLNICSNENAVVIKKMILNVLRHDDNSSFLNIQDAIIKVSTQLLKEIKSKDFSINSKYVRQMNVELNRRIGMAYNRKGNKPFSIKFFMNVILLKPVILFSDASFLKELSFILIPGDLLIYFRRLQLKLGSKEI